MLNTKTQLLDQEHRQYLQYRALLAELSEKTLSESENDTTLLGQVKSALEKLTQFVIYGASTDHKEIAS